MKKILASLLLLLAFTYFYAQEAQEESNAPQEEATESSESNDDLLKEENVVDLTKKTITPDDQHLDPQDKTGSIVIEYTPMVDEARVTYTCMYNLYEQGRAMNAILGCLEDFTKQNKYYHYRYMEKDKEKYSKDDRGIKWTQYIVHVKLSRK